MKKNEEFYEALRHWNRIALGHSMRGVFAHSKATGLSMAQLGALNHLHRHGACGVSAISQVLGVSSAASSQMLDRLVQQDLISRVEDPHDRRAKQIELTSKGQHLLDASLQARDKWLDDLAATLSPAEQAQVTQALQILIAKVHQLEPEPLPI